MTLKEFGRAMAELDCDSNAIKRVSALCVRMWNDYSWLALEEFLAVALGMVPRAKERWRPERMASFSTYLVTIIRNALRSMVNKELKQRTRFEVPGTVEAGVYVDSSEVDFVDVRHTLALVLSPLAWRLLQKSLDASPERLSNRSLSEDLNVSVATVLLLKQEVQSTARIVLRSEENL